MYEFTIFCIFIGLVFSGRYGLKRWSKRRDLNRYYKQHGMSRDEINKKRSRK